MKTPDLPEGKPSAPNKRHSNPIADLFPGTLPLVVATAAHEYIARKLGLPDGLRVYSGSLTIAGQNCDGALMLMDEATALAAATGACVLLVHHVAKGSTREIRSSLDAMEAIQNSDAIAGAARAAYVLWPTAVKTFNNAWWSAGAETRGDVPYLSRSGLLEYLTGKMGISEASAKQYVKPSVPGKLIHDLLLGEIIESIEHGWIVLDSVLASSMMIRRGKS